MIEAQTVETMINYTTAFAISLIV